MTMRFALHRQPDNEPERSKAQQMARHDPHGKEDLGERFSQFASAHGTAVGNDLRSDNDTPALNALKALRGAPISMGRGETPVLRIGRRYIIRRDVIHKFMEANQGVDLLVREQIRAVR